MAYMGMGDLLKQWIYTRRGVEKIMRRDDFPRPAFTINGGRTKVWHTADIAEYTRIHPELTSEAAKHRKVVGYALGNFQKKARNGAPRPAAE